MNPASRDDLDRAADLIQQTIDSLASLRPSDEAGQRETLARARLSALQTRTAIHLARAEQDEPPEEPGADWYPS